MKIDTAKIPDTGLELEEVVESGKLDLDTDNIKFIDSIKISAKIAGTKSVVYIGTHIEARERITCSRCLNEFEMGLSRDFNFSYAVNPEEPFIDVTENIREEILLDLPIKSLCRQDCKGFCTKCGKNLNEGQCNCQMKS